jgi:undecaprenyl-diphosphatase
MLHPVEAVLLGILEGLTEFLPVSSTGHLILAAHFLRLEGEAVKTFEIVIQAGALGAVLVLYRARAAAIWRGLLGRDPAGRQLLLKLLASFLPAAVIGVALHRVIKAHLFGVAPVVAALAAGGVLMLWVDRRTRRHPEGGRTLETLTMAEAWGIGAAQCLSLWPGASRAMVTIVAGLLVGLPGPAAAEYSFLLAVPTLGAATLFDAVTGGAVLLERIGPASVASGFAAAAVVATVAIRGFLAYLTRRGLAPFGWYRLGLAALVWMVVT